MMAKSGNLRLLLIIGTVLVISGCAFSDQSKTTGHRDDGTAQLMSDPGARIARAALDVLGTPYVYGGNSINGFDCSGLVQYAHAQAGIRIPRTTGVQFNATGQPVKLRVGDVLFFKIKGLVSHNGIYVGEGRFVHAPSTGKNVTVARTDNAYFRKRLAGVRRFR